MLVFPNNDLPGVYGAGGVQTLVNVYGVKPGKKVLMVGSGNVGLIVSYQLLQAGMEVKAVVEALPKIGGYFVHAAKLRRFGVPIYVSHTVKEVHGRDRVEGATIVRLDEDWNEIPGTEKRIDCDIVCLAVGLSPSVRLVSQTGAEVVYVPEAGGFVALHNEYMETSRRGVFVAGDLSSIEEASVAMLEGKIAGLSAIKRLGMRVDDNKIEMYRKKLEMLRSGPFGERGRKAKEKIREMWRKKYGGL
jgi:sarcosine oxidase subunit alpha